MLKKTCLVAGLSGLILGTSLVGCAGPEGEEPEAQTAALMSKVPAAPTPAKLGGSGTNVTGARTFGTSPTAKDLPAWAKEKIRKEHGDVVWKSIEKDLDAYRYVPSSTLRPPEADPGAPITGSFIEDALTARKEVDKRLGGSVSMSCASRPCVLRADFDGDKRLDMAVQVMHKTLYTTGVALLLADGRHVQLGAGKSGPLGADFLWLEGISLLPQGAQGNSDMTGAGLSIRGDKNNATVYLTKSGVKAFWR